MELTASFLKAFLGITEEKAQEILDSEDAGQQMKTLNAANLKKKFDEGEQKGRGVVVKSIKSAIKTTYDVDVTGESPEEIVSSLKEHVSEQGADEISEDVVKAHPLFKAEEAKLVKITQEGNKVLEKRLKEALKEKEEGWEKEKKALKKSTYLTELEVEAKDWLVSEGAILHSDPEKQKKQIQKFVRDIADANDLDKDADGRILFSKDNTPLTNKEGHNATARDLFRENDYMFSFQATQQRQSTQLDPRNPGGQQRTFQHYKGEVPKTEQEYKAIEIKRVNREISAEAFKEVEAAWAEQNAK